MNLVFMDEKLGKDICVVSPTVTERELQVRLSDVGQYSPKRDARNLPASPTASKYAAVPKHLVNNIAPDYYNSTNIDYVMHDGHTSLWCMSAKGNAEGVRWFLDSGANVDSLSKNFETPLHPAVYNGHREVVLELVSRGADVDAVRFGDRTPLSLAIECDKADAGVALLDAGADIEKVTAKSPYPEWVTNYLNVREMEGKLDACKSTPVLEQVPLARLNTFLDELNSWLEENPEDVSSYIQRARVFRRLNRFSEACVDYGCAFNLSNDLDHAMETFDRAIKMNPKNVIAIIERGNLARKSNILPLAIAYYKKACALDPNNVKALIKLGSAYRKAGENDKALDAYNKARGLDPNSIKAQSKGGWVLASLQRWSEASDAYKSVLALDPARKSAHQNYIHLLILLKRWSEAAESCEQACEMFPEDVNLEKFHKKAQKELEKSYQAKAEQNVADQNESVSDNRM